MGGIPKNLSSTTPDQRRSVYKELEQLLMIGFMDRPLTINGLRLSMRTPHPSDMYFLKSFGETLSLKESKIYMIARCIWRVNHHIILGDTNAFSQLVEILNKTPKNVITILYNILLYLLRESNSLYDGVEPYSYEYYSRYFWKTMNGTLPCDPRVTMIQGTDSLGLNNLQRAWCFYNSLEDKRSTDLVSWSESKFVASAMIGKGIQKVNSADQNARKKEENHRQALQDAFYYYRLKVISYPDFKKIISGDMGILLDEASQLEEEMQRVLSGEKDEHDIIIEMAQRKMLEELQPSRPKQPLNLDNLAKNTRVVGYTPDQMQKLLKETPKSKTSKPAISPQKAYFLENIIKPVIVPGRIIVNGDNISVQPEIPESLNKNEIVDKDISLNDLLNSRKIVVDS